MRIYKPQNEFGQDLLSTADMVNSTKTITKAIADGKVEITAVDLGTDKASDWTVLEVVYGGNKIMADVASTDDKITVTLDNADSTFSGDVVVTLNYEKSMNISQEAQEAPVVTHAEIRGLVDGTSLFHNGPIDVWDCDLPDLENGLSMFSKCKSLTSFTSDMPALTDGDEMFRNCINLISFAGDLSGLTTAYMMFRGCDNLTSFSVDLPALTDGDEMFNYCEKLTSFSVDLPVMTNGEAMFQNCSSLTSFSGDLPKLTNGDYMFYGCTSLTSFSGDLPKLIKGNFMFYDCKLDKESVNRIANSLPSTEFGDVFIDIGVDANLVTEEDLNAAKEIIRGKGWMVSIRYN